MNSLEFASKFLAKPLQVKVGNWETNYLSFCKPKNAHKTPIVILGGAFQKFHSFKKDVETLMEDVPVYLVDLPGQGGNEQIAENLSFEDYADILLGFVERMGIEKITPIALSYGSAIGYYFASKYPDRTDKLILGGTTIKLRESVRSLLEESLKALERGEMKDFSAGVVLNLLNFSQRDRIKGSDFLSKSLYRSMQKLSEKDRAKYVHNTVRLLSLDNLPLGPSCETLVLAGEFDNFTTPAECFEVAKRCYNSSFGIVKDTDHLAPYDRKDLVNKIYKKFLKGEKINRIRDLELFEKEEYPTSRMQIEPRWMMDDIAYLESSNGVLVPISVVDINSQGIKLFTCFNQHRALKFEKKFVLHMTDQSLEIEVILFDEGDDGHYKGIFKHCNIAKTILFEGFIERLAMMNDEAISAA